MKEGRKSQDDMFDCPGLTVCFSGFLSTVGVSRGRADLWVFLLGSRGNFRNLLRWENFCSAVSYWALGLLSLLFVGLGGFSMR